MSRLHYGILRLIERTLTFDRLRLQVYPQLDISLVDPLPVGTEVTDSDFNLPSLLSIYRDRNPLLHQFLLSVLCLHLSGQATH